MEKVKKEPTRSERRDTKTMRHKIIDINLLKEVGEGNQQKGFEEIIHVYRSVKKDPVELCMVHISKFVRDVEYYGVDINIKNFSGMVRMWLKHGGNLDPSILDEKPNTSILDEKPEKSTNKLVEDKKHTKVYTSLIEKIEKK